MGHSVRSIVWVLVYTVSVIGEGAYITIDYWQRREIKSIHILSLQLERGRASDNHGHSRFNSIPLNINSRGNYSDLAQYSRVNDTFTTDIFTAIFFHVATMCVFVGEVIFLIPNKSILFTVYLY